MNESLPANVIEKRDLRDRIAVFRNREPAVKRAMGGRVRSIRAAAMHRD